MRQYEHLKFQGMMIDYRAAGLILAGYLIGSIPWGLILTRLFSDKNIYREGSGNMGATNVRRVAGTPLGILTLLGDILKGCLPLLLAVRLTRGGEIGGDWLLALVTIAAVGGHFFPLYLKGRGGGKGVATTAGCFLVLAPGALLISMAVFWLACRRFNHVSSGSLSAAAVLPPAVWLTGHSGSIIICAMVLAIAIGIRHRTNIRRLQAGCEPVLWKKNK
jgi:glycerol-3-phosphate acyltransferase PlsY